MRASAIGETNERTHTLTTATEPTCQVLQQVSKVICQLPAGHEGVHIHFGPNGTTAWGFSWDSVIRKGRK